MQDDQQTLVGTSKDIVNSPLKMVTDKPNPANSETETYADRPTSPFSIPCAITRDYFRVAGETYHRHEESGKYYPFTPMGKSKWKFDWIHENDTFVCELPIGMKIQVDYYKDYGTVEIYSKKKFISVVHAPQLYDSVCRAIRAGSIVSGTSYAIIPGATNVFFIPKPEDMLYGHVDEPLNEAISLDTLMRKHRFNQWHVGTKTVDSVSKWLMEDLRSKLHQSWRYTCATSDTDCDNKKARPDGLLFFNKGLEKFARIMCRDFEWFYEEGKACKETHDYEVFLDKNKADFAGNPELSPLDAS